MDNELVKADLVELISQIRDDLDGAIFPSAKEYNDGLDRGTEIAIDRIELLLDLYSD